MHVEGRNPPGHSLTVPLTHSTLAKSRFFTALREVRQPASPPSSHPGTQRMHKCIQCSRNTPTYV